jgi:hypothetical protein
MSTSTAASELESSQAKSARATTGRRCAGSWLTEGTDLARPSQRRCVISSYGVNSCLKTLRTAFRGMPQSLAAGTMRFGTRCRQISCDGRISARFTGTTSKPRFGAPAITYCLATLRARKRCAAAPTDPPFTPLLERAGIRYDAGSDGTTLVSPPGAGIGNGDLRGSIQSSTLTRSWGRPASISSRLV